MATDRQIVAQDWTPWLTRAPGLVQKLGFCVSIAATPEVSCIRLAHVQLRTPDLASNLIHITNQGQNAFLEAYSQLLEISARTDDMAAEGGSLDQLNEMFGDPESQRACLRILRALERDVKTCEENGERTQAAFTTWRECVDNVKEAIVATQNETNSLRLETITDKTLLKDELEVQDSIIKHAEVARQATEQNYQTVLEVHRHRETQLQEYAQATIAYGTIQNVPGMLSAAVGAGVYGIMTAMSYDQALKAEQELERKKQIGRELELEMKKISLAIVGLKDEEDRLGELMKIIIAVLSLLEGLSGDIVSLLVYFRVMNAQIKMLVKKHKIHTEIAGDLSRDMLEAPDEELNRADFDQFHKQLVEMKRASLVVNALSSLYADVITNAINPGFAQVMAASRGDISDLKTSSVLAAKERELQDYIEVAESMCMEKSRQANTTLREKLAVVDEEAARRRLKVKKTKHRSKPMRDEETSTFRSNNSNFSGGTHRSRFSRMMGRRS